MTDHPGGEDGYSGAATLSRDDLEIAVQVTLRGQLDPISGHYHWYGRVTADPALAALATGRGEVLLATPHATVPTRLTDPDPWGRFRVEGRGHAPFPVLGEVPDA